MSKVCKITGKRPLSGNTVSHANNRTKRRQYPNIQTKKIFVPELDKSVKVKISAKALKSITAQGLVPYLKKQGIALKDVI
jgi:large subunit ribosomal protein L28